MANWESKKLSNCETPQLDSQATLQQATEELGNLETEQLATEQISNRATRQLGKWKPSNGATGQPRNGKMNNLANGQLSNWTTRAMGQLGNQAILNQATKQSSDGATKQLSK